MEPFDMFTLTVNSASIVLMLLMVVLLLAATRFRGANGYAALVIVLTTIPVYLYNICRMQHWYATAVFLAPLAYSVNTLLLPLLWLFTKYATRADTRFKPVELLHFVPAVFFFVLYCFVSADSSISMMNIENSGHQTVITALNLIVLVVQMAVYYPIIFTYLKRLRYRLRDSCSDADLWSMMWVLNFNRLSLIFLFVIYAVYAVDTRTDTWLPQILNVVLMGYLVYKSILYPTSAFVRNRPEESIRQGADDDDKLTEHAAAITSFLESSEAYIEPDLSLRQLSEATGISMNNVSKAINKVLGQTFFELVNGMRVEKAKRLLLNDDYSSQTIEALAQQCGFRSRTSFYEAFYRIERSTPARWKRAQNSTDSK